MDKNLHEIGVNELKKILIFEGKNFFSQGGGLASGPFVASSATSQLNPCWSPVHKRRSLLLTVILLIVDFSLDCK